MLVLYMVDVLTVIRPTDSIAQANMYTVNNTVCNLAT